VWNTLANAQIDAGNTVTDVLRRGALLSSSGSVACSTAACTTGTCCQIVSDAGPPIGYRVFVRFPVGSVTGFLPASMIPDAALSRAVMRREE
jgi:hypothetical protein